MEVVQHIAALEQDGALMADVAADTNLDAPIPTCPDWTMRDLVRHTGGVHRWATGYVAGHRIEPWDVDLGDIVGSWPADDVIVEWFRLGHAALVATLEAAPEDGEWFTFLDAPSPLAMWSRRQAHETAIHRADAESANGAITASDPRFAADGIDELLSCFMSRPGRRLPIDSPRSMLVVAGDTEDVWHVAIAGDRMTTTRRRGTADTTMTGAASDLYLLLWNRAGATRIDVAGDADLLEFWRNEVKVNWR